MDLTGHVNFVVYVMLSKSVSCGWTGIGTMSSQKHDGRKHKAISWSKKPATKRSLCCLHTRTASCSQREVEIQQQSEKKRNEVTRGFYRAIWAAVLRKAKAPTRAHSCGAVAAEAWNLIWTTVTTALFLQELIFDIVLHIASTEISSNWSTHLSVHHQLTGH